MYVRFAVQGIDAYSSRKQGLLVASSLLLDEGRLEKHEAELVQHLVDWFNEHLRVPSVLKSWDTIRALSWFKASAAKPIGQMWELTHVLRAHGEHVEFFNTDDPGNIIYEDKWQVVATPRKGQRRPW
ncbi:MAG: hypothetical protein AAF430_18450 [Myxococcota bacterium]